MVTGLIPGLLSYKKHCGCFGLLCWTGSEHLRLIEGCQFSTCGPDSSRGSFHMELTSFSSSSQKAEMSQRPDSSVRAAYDAFREAV